MDRLAHIHFHMAETDIVALQVKAAGEQLEIKVSSEVVACRQQCNNSKLNIYLSGVAVAFPLNFGTPPIGTV